MKHPFYKILYKALGNSTADDNLVLKEAEKIREKGYSAEEIYGVLQKLREGLLDDADIEIVDEALEEFEGYVD